MDKLNWDYIAGIWHDLLYNHTEIVIWGGLVLLVITLFWLMVYSVAIRRFMAVVIVLAALIGYGLYYYGYLDVQPTIVAPAPVATEPL